MSIETYVHFFLMWSVFFSCSINIIYDYNILLSMQKKSREISRDLKDYEDKVRKIENI